jgi:hypothetical protein
MRKISPVRDREDLERKAGWDELSYAGQERRNAETHDRRPKSISVKL